MVIRTQNGRNGLTGLGTLWGTLFGVGHAKEVSFQSTPPPPPSPGAGGVGGYNHRDTGEEGEWRPPLLYANPLGHCVPDTLFIARFMRTDMSGDHYEMISKVAFGVSRLGGGCTGCVGVNIAYIPRWFKERGDFGPSPPPLQGAQMFKGCRGQGLRLGTPHGNVCLPLLWASHPCQSVSLLATSYTYTALPDCPMERLTFAIVRADSPTSDRGPSPPPTADVGFAAFAADIQDSVETLDGAIHFHQSPNCAITVFCFEQLQSPCPKKCPCPKK